MKTHGFFQNFWCFSLKRLTGQHWSQRESLAAGVLDSWALPWISLLTGNCFPSHIFLSTQDLVLSELGDALCYPVLLDGLSPKQRETSQTCLPYICTSTRSGCWGSAVCPMLLRSQHSYKLSWVLVVGQHEVKCVSHANLISWHPEVGTRPFSLLGVELPQEHAVWWEISHSSLQEQHQRWRARSPWFLTDSPGLLGISTLYCTYTVLLAELW